MTPALGGDPKDYDTFKAGGVSISGTPAAGQVLTASDAENAAWQTPGGGGPDLTDTGKWWAGTIVRALNTNYVNGTKKRLVSVGITATISAAGDSALAGYKTVVGGTVVDASGSFGLADTVASPTMSGLASTVQFTFWVDPGATYSVPSTNNGSGGTVALADWQETDF